MRVSQSSIWFVLVEEEDPTELRTASVAGHYEAAKTISSQIYGEFYNRMSFHGVGEIWDKF